MILQWKHSINGLSHLVVVTHSVRQGGAVQLGLINECLTSRLL